jgi:2-oxoglutarate dehydrogenase E1 component
MFPAMSAAPPRSGFAPSGTPPPRPGPPVPEGAKPLRGGAALIAGNMRESLGVPTATSIRVVPAKLLEVNRTILNNQLGRVRGGKVSFTHLIGWAVVKAMQALPVMTTSYHEADGRGYAVRPEHLNLGLAVDVERRDGGRTLLVPNIKTADTLDFAGFWQAYEQVIRAVKANKLDPSLFEGTTATLTNPGTVGTVGSVPRLMPGQSVIVGTGAIQYPAEYAGADPRTLAAIGVGKVLTVTSTYDHRVIQGAESGLFLKYIHELLTGEHDFYADIFTSLSIPYAPVAWHVDEQGPAGAAVTGGGPTIEKQVAVGKLINAYRVRGHLIANLNPLQHTFQHVHPELDPATYGLSIWDLEREFATGGLGAAARIDGNVDGTERMRLGDILGVLRDAYCRTVGVEYMFISEPGQKAWIQAHVEGQRSTLDVEDQRHILGQLNAAEAFEKFLHTKYIGQKRFSMEGAESTIPMLDALLSKAADEGITDAVLGMAHRGRLNVLSNIIGKSFDKIFREFEGDVDPESVQGTGDVKYHLGSRGTHTSPAGNTVELLLSSNPSHLEAVDSVVEGIARAKLDRLDGDGSEWPVLPVLIHGDAAFAGQGVVAETFGLSQLRGYRTGGTVHLVINNQVGFTTSPDQGRSSTYATDVAKTVQAPIFHVNGDDPEACVRVMRLALDFRQAFHKDVVVDLVCYRRWGHNEGDDPSYTQPIMYAAIEERRSVRKRYMEELVTRGDITVEEAERALDDFRNRLEQALKETRESSPPKPTGPPRRHPIVGVLPHVETGMDRATLERISQAVTSAPDGFTIHPKLGRQLEKRRDQLARDEVDWAMGEALAFGSLVLEGTPVRLAGQDSRRGTFSQRHSVLVDYHTGGEHIPLQHLDARQAPFMPYDSPLNEFATLGFEYGYSVERKEALVCWEAQFGDFVNGAQVILDQFLVAAEEKWGQTSGLVLLLPHGYEGQGPEHSSARIERFLTLCAQDNIQVVQPTTAAQYFHVLRRQMHRDVRKPLVVITPKGLLRAKPASSPASAFTSGSFAEVLHEDKPPTAEDVRRVLLCSGRVAFDLVRARDKAEAPAAVVRLEQLYPFPSEGIREAVEHFPNAREVFWVQDEPENMGPWPFAQNRLREVLGDGPRLRHVARAEAASPATGSATIHEQEQTWLLERSLEGLDAKVEGAGEARVRESAQAAS